jgi:phosphoribosylanthranilate isomerase
LTYIKICGITNVDDACFAAKAGADLLGFILTPKSPRYVTVPEAAAIAAAVRGTFGACAPRIVGVFVDEPIECVQGILNVAQLDLAQLHGDESPDDVRRLSPRAFKAVRPQDSDQARAAHIAYGDTVPQDDTLPQLLVDAYHPHRHGGTGLQADLDLACWLARRVRLLLAGGLTPENVGEIVKRVQPWGVDVSSGVERSKRIKDNVRVRAFIDAVCSATGTAHRAIGEATER